MAKSLYPDPPIHSEDPADWFMFCDILQDAGASRFVWQKSLRIATSLQKNPNLLLVSCSKDYNLYGRAIHWGFPANKPSVIRLCNHVWMRPEWRKMRFSANTPNQFCYCTPTKHSGDLNWLFQSRVHISRCRAQFFHVHSLRRCPSLISHYRNRF